MKYRANLFNTTVGTAPGWNSTNTITVGVIIAELTDWDTGLPSGVRLSIVDAAPTGKSSSGGLVTGSPHGIEQSVWANYFTYTSGTTSKLLFDEITLGSSSQFKIGDTVNVRFAALNTSNRDLTLTAAGGGSGTYDNSVITPPTANPPAPVIFSTVIQDDGSGKAAVLLSVAVSTLVTNLQFIEVFSAKINSIGDGIVRIGETQTWSVTGFTPTSATIDGIALAGVNGTGFTMPDYDDPAIPDYGYRVVSATDGVITSTFNVYVEPKTGYHYTRIEDVSATGDGYLQAHYPDLAVGWTITLLNGDEFDPAVEKNNISVFGEVITDHEGLQEIYVWKATDRSIDSLELDTTSPGGYTVSLLSGKKLSVSKISASKLIGSKFR